MRLSATAQEIDPGAAICRIREARHSTEEYERLKPNDRAPLDVWRIEVLVANYSGNALDYLNAHLNVESSWPPCDHWDGPEAHYGAPLVWTGHLISIQDVRVRGARPGVPGDGIVLTWHEEEPALGRWDINYTFAASPPTGVGSGTQDTRSENTGVDATTALDAGASAAAPNGLPARIQAEGTCVNWSGGARAGRR